jgi:ABC-type transport system substrate-binding protein
MQWTGILNLVFTALLITSGCGEQPKDEEKDVSQVAPSIGGTYRVPLLQNPSSLDPALVHDEYGRVVIHQIFEGLVRFDPHLLIEPELARTWSVEENGTLYRFFLKTDARFHDGSPVTAEDVVFSLKRLLRVTPPSVLLPHLLLIEGAEDYGNGSTEHVTGLAAPDHGVVTIRLRKPHFPFLVVLGMHQAKIVPREAVLRLGEEFGNDPVGSGPFRFLSWEGGKQITLGRFQEYHGTPAHLREIQFRIYPGQDFEEITKNFEAGALEEMPGYGNLREKLPPGSYTWLHRPALSLLFYGLRTDHPALEDPLFRQALSLAIDRRELVKSVYGGRFLPAAGIIPPGLPGYTPPGTPLEGDLVKAMELVGQAFGSGRTPPPMEIVSASRSAFAMAEMEYIKRRWAVLGVEVNLKYITDWPEFQSYLLSDRVMAYRYAWTADIPDPDNFFCPLFSSDAASNFTRYGNPDVDRIIQEARSLLDPLQRAQAYTRLEQTILEDSPIIPLFYLSVDRIYQPYVKGVTLSALDFQDTRLHRVWLDSAGN